MSGYDYTYRVNTQVITSVTVSGGQADPDHPVTARFTIGGQTYTVNNIYYPESDSQLVWVRWTTPSTPQTMTIHVSVTGRGRASQGTITANIVDLSGHEPPNPVADDRNDSYTQPAVPNNPQKTSATWGVWRPWWHAYWVWHSTGEDSGYWCDHGWWEFDWNTYTASLSASMSVVPDAKILLLRANHEKRVWNQSDRHCKCQHQPILGGDGAQTAVTYFPNSGISPTGACWRGPVAASAPSLSLPGTDIQPITGAPTSRPSGCRTEAIPPTPT